HDLSAYLPIIVISITDGPIFLQSDLFNANQRPAVDVGVSVSRVGGDAQVKAMKKVSGTLRIDLAQYRDMEAFSMFASDLDASTRRQLDRGARLMELLKQPQYTPYPVEEQVVSIWAGSRGHMDEIPVSDIFRFAREFPQQLRLHNIALPSIADTGLVSDDGEDVLVQEVTNVKKAYLAEGSDSLVQAGDEEHDAIDDGSVEQGQIVRQKR